MGKGVTLILINHKNKELLNKIWSKRLKKIKIHKFVI